MQQPPPRRRIVPPSAQTPATPAAGGGFSRSSTISDGAGGFASALGGHLRPSTLGVPPSPTCDGSSASLLSLTSFAKIVICIILAIGTISILSFDIIDVDAFFGIEEVHLPESIFAKKDIAEPHEYDPISVAYLRKKLESKNLKPDLRKKIVEKLKVIDEIEAKHGKPKLNTAKQPMAQAKNAQSHIQETSGSKPSPTSEPHSDVKSSQKPAAPDSKPVVTGKEQISPGPVKSNEPIINPEIYKEALMKMHVGFSVLYDKVKENIDYAQENIDTTALKSSLNIDTDLLKSTVFDQLKPLMSKLNLKGVDLSDNDQDGIPDVMESDADADGVPDILEDKDNDGIPDILGDSSEFKQNIEQIQKERKETELKKRTKSEATLGEKDDVEATSEIFYGDYDDDVEESTPGNNELPVEEFAESPEERKTQPDKVAPKPPKLIPEKVETKSKNKTKAGAAKPKPAETAKPVKPNKVPAEKVAQPTGVPEIKKIKCAPFDKTCAREVNPHLQAVKTLIALCPKLNPKCLSKYKTQVMLDTDEDGIPDFLEGDMDNDGVEDRFEIDSDGDGEEDFMEEDEDGDGIPDGLQYDTDGDGIPDAFEDEDNDGIYDIYSRDSDGDGIPDFLEDDDDDDVLDFLETIEPEFLETEAVVYGEEGEDDTGDGDDDDDDESDVQGDDDDEANESDEELGLEDIEPYVADDDEDGDGIPDYLEGDLDENGILDFLEDEEFMSHPFNQAKYAEMLQNQKDEINSGQRKLLWMGAGQVASFGLRKEHKVTEDSIEGVPYDDLIAGEETATASKANSDESTGVKDEISETRRNTIHDESESPFYSEYDLVFKDQLRSVERLLEKKLYVDTDKMCSKLLSNYPNSGYVLLLKGVALRELAEKQRSNEVLQKAIDAFEAAAKSEPDKDTTDYTRTEAYVLAARSLDFLGKSSAAVLSQALRSYPANDTIARLNVVRLLKSGQNEKAEKFIKERLAKGLDEAFNLVHLGFILNQRNEYEEAVKDITKGLTQDSSDKEVHDGRMYNALGNALIRLNRKDEADTWYGVGAKRGVFLSQFQRSLYNARRPLKALPWWSKADANKAMKDAILVLEKNWRGIRDEALKIMDQKTGLFEAEGEGLQREGDWKQFTLYSRGRRDKRACEKTPFTCKIVEAIPDATSCKRGQIKFSLMQPDTYVWPHTGPTNCRIRMHLGLIVPPGPRIRVAHETRQWKEGKVIMFDDSFEHEVWHNGTSQRLVLIVDIWHPELTPSERQMLTAI